MRCIKKHVGFGKAPLGTQANLCLCVCKCTAPSVHSATTALFQWKFYYFMYLFVCPSRVLGDILAYWDT